VSLGAAASIELAPLMNLVMGELQGVIPHDRVAIQTYENGCLTVLAASDRSPAGEKAERRDGYQVDVADNFFTARFPDGMPAIIDDILDEGDLAAGYRAVAHPHINSGLVPHGAYMAIPLMSRDDVVGLLTVMRDQPGFYTADHARLGRAIGSQIAIAVDRARLFEETRRSARETEALVRADSELFRSLDPDKVLQALADVAVDVVGVDTSVVTIWDRETGTVEVRASRNLAPGELEAFKAILPPAGGALPDDVEPNIYESLEEVPESIREVMRPFGKQAAMDVPIRSATGEILGGYGVGYAQPHVFTSDERRLLFALADRAAVAMQNAALYERAQQVGSLEERQRLARELHDSVSQALYGIALGTRTARLRLGDDPHNAAEPIDYVASLAQAGLAEMRALIFELRPESLEQEGLVAAIEKHAASTRARYGLDVRLELMEEPDLAIEKKEALYRITQEALHNVVKHAEATTVRVSLTRDGDVLVLTVADDGRGFDANASYPGHVGLQSMSERAERFAGAVSVDSVAGKGTTVTARLPA
jgi:signal transduction histidine kinase